MGNVVYGLRNLWRFRKVVWRWRAWDYEYSYELFVVALLELGETISRNDHHTRAQEDAADIAETARLLTAFQDATWTEEEDAAWDALHDHLKAHARAWWD